MTVNNFADEDLHDLIGEEEGASKSERKPLNLDHLSQGELDVPAKRTTNSVSCWALICAYLSYICDYAPRLCWTLGIVALVVPSYFLIMSIWFNPTEHFGVTNDYTAITSKFDLTIGKIDHWCLKGDNDSCRCEDPLDPISRGEFKAWSRAHFDNVDKVQALLTQGNTSPDIAFFGASVVEEMGGRWFGKEDDDENLTKLKSMFTKNFQKSNGAELDAVALGIAGDSNPTVLWRLLNGEMPEAFNPKIWWLEVGLNDLGRSQCSEEVVVLGVLRIIEEIMSSKPNAIIVINSLFPLADLRGGMRVGEADYKDGFDDKLRQRPTNKIDREHFRSNRRSNGGSDFGDGTHIRHAVPERPSHGGRAQPSMARDRDGGRQLALLEEPTISGDRRLSWLGFLQGPQRVKMQAHKDKQKKYRPLSHHERKLPLWTSITAVNDQLRKFAANNIQVHFFDATKIFTDREDSDMYTLKTDMISIRGHPSLAGFEAWEAEVVKEAKSLLGLKGGN